MVENRPFLPTSISTAHRLVPMQGVLTNKYVKERDEEEQDFQNWISKMP